MLDKLEDELEAIIKCTKSSIKFSYFNDGETVLGTIIAKSRTIIVSLTVMLSYKRAVLVTKGD